MSTVVPAEIVERLKRFDQFHLLRWWDQLDAEARRQLIRQIDAVDFGQISRIWTDCQTGGSASAGEDGSRIDRAAAPIQVIHQPKCEEDFARRRMAEEIGSRLLREGKVAVITVAGGQGSRLGFEHPKGMFPIGPVTERTLFQIFAEQILARRRRHGGEILWMIMTSSATHAETVEFFEQQSWFGLEPETVVFFQQGALPALDAASGRLLLEAPGSLCLSPDGHGGLIEALRRSGLLQRMSDAGIEYVFYHQVDNPVVILCDPVLLGFHHEQGSSLTTNVVQKTGPAERMGVLADVDGHVEIIEYSELTPEQSARRDATGQWIFWAGNTAIHVFSRAFLEELSQDGCRLPLHAARKNVAHLNDEGQFVQPSDAANPNAIKLERFIFDALPMASRTLIVEGNRSREFSPVKNRDGVDSPATARASLSSIVREWLQSAGVSVDPDQSLELSPLTALDAEELADAVRSGKITIDQLVRG